jgi:hypothetical protein
MRLTGDCVDHYEYAPVYNLERKCFASGGFSVFDVLSGMWFWPAPVDRVVEDTMEFLETIAAQVLDCETITFPLTVAAGGDIVTVTIVKDKYNRCVVDGLEGPRLYQALFRSFVAAQFDTLCSRVPFDTFLDFAVRRCKVDATTLIPHLLRTETLITSEITAKYLSLVRDWGASPQPGTLLGSTILKNVFQAKRLETLDSPARRPCSCCAPTGDPVFYDAILDDLAARGLVVDPASPGDYSVEVFWSMDPAYLDWFLTRYPAADLSALATGWTHSPASCMFNHRAVTTRHATTLMMDVLTKHGRDAIVKDVETEWQAYKARFHL